MSGNLPPGVTEGMIPGNRPEDAEYEKWAEKAYDDLSKILPQSVFENDEIMDRIIDKMWERELAAFNRGWDEHRAEVHLVRERLEEELDNLPGVE